MRDNKVKNIIFTWNSALINDAEELYRLANAKLRNVNASSVDWNTFTSSYNPQNPAEFFIKFSQGRITTTQRYEQFCKMPENLQTEAPWQRSAKRVLQTLNEKEKRIFIVAEALPKNNVLNRLHRDYMKFVPDKRVYCSDKPDKKEVLEMIIQEHRLVPYETAVVSDRPAYIKAGKICGMKTIAAMCGWGPDSELITVKPDSILGGIDSLRYEIH